MMHNGYHLMIKWLRNKSSLVEDKKTGLTHGCYAHTVKFRSHRLNEHNFEFTTFFASYIKDYVVGAWTAVNKQISMRYQGADIAPAGLHHHNRSIFSLPIPHKHSIEHKKYDVINERE